MKIVAVIQARMGSTRFPAKVLKPLVGRPVLWHIIHRLRKCETVDEVVIATSVKAGDDPLVGFAASMGVRVCRGPEDDVLRRFLIAAEATGADVIVRVTGDAPLVDPATVDALVRLLCQRGADYVTAEPGVPCIHEGFSPMSASVLRRLASEKGDHPVAREHVTAYFKQDPAFARCVCFDVPAEHRFAGARLSVDVPADLVFLERIYALLGQAPGEADVAEVVRLLKRCPELLKLNAAVRQKGAGETTRRVLIRCDGGRQIGTGHVVRCLALADELREKHGTGITFAIWEDKVAVETVAKEGYAVEFRGAGECEATWLEEVIERTAPDCLVMDFRTDLERERVERWRSRGVLIVTIDDPNDRRLAADLAFYPPVPQVECMDWSGFTGERHTGWDWVILRRQFAQAHKASPSCHCKGEPCVLVTMGGSDPGGLTSKAVDALKQVGEAFRAVILLGPAFSGRRELNRRLEDAQFPFDIRENVQNMAGLMRSADFAVASFGVTAYELAASGVPAVYMCLTDDHAKSSTAFVQAGIAVSVGRADIVVPKTLPNTIEDLLRSSNVRKEMGLRASELVDGSGGERVAACVMAAVGAGYE